jgi:hypothetical protein
MEQYGAEILALVAGNEPDRAGESNAFHCRDLCALDPISGRYAAGDHHRVVTDLDGLLTVAGLAQLLTAGPDEVDSFSDHPHFAALHGSLTAEEMEQETRQAIEAGKLAVSTHQR